MEKLSPSCQKVTSNVAKTYNYDEYYIGEKDENNRKQGQGENHWSGAKCLEWYNGHYVANTMHGLGEYRWRFLGEEGAHFTYEGYFYCNTMHGYGTMSYPDGRVFRGLFHSNVRWGPGIESQACLKEDVGLWRGTQLVRLTWRPSAPSIAPDFTCNIISKACVNCHRIKLASKCKTVGQTNSAIDLLKQYGCDPKKATENWTKLYPNNCTDVASLLCHAELFQRDYYKGKIYMLEEIPNNLPYVRKEEQSHTDGNHPDSIFYFAWNNTKLAVHMMKHCYTHDTQRDPLEIDLNQILSGPREKFRAAGKHETDCRTLLMASYLGHLPSVIQLLNEFQVHQDIADSLGNSAVMYATCGDRKDVIHFLVEAGANVDIYNDSCCTPLAVALLRFICILNDIPPSAMVQALLPPLASPTVPIEGPEAFEWNYSRDQTFNPLSGINKTPSKLSRAVSLKKLKSANSLKDLQGGKKKPVSVKSQPSAETNSIDSLDEKNKLYNNINNEFLILLNDMYFNSTPINPITYVLEVHDMFRDIECLGDEQKKTLDKAPRKINSKVIKDTMKPSKEIMWQSNDEIPIDGAEKQKMETLDRVMLTILQLLSDGANPKFIKSPKPALFIAVMSGSAKLVKHLVNYGADINEVYKETFEYTPLDLAVSRPFSSESVDLVRTTLECGAHPNRRLSNRESFTDSISAHLGPTLLHAVLARRTDNEMEEEDQMSLIKLLLEYNFDPFLQYKGQSAISMSMMKNIKLLDVFVQSPKVNLNISINDMQETVLMKMFSIPFFKTMDSSQRLQTLTNLLLFGADPLLECRNGDRKFPNIFAYAKQTLYEFENSNTKSSPMTPNKPDLKKPEKPKKDKKEPVNTKSTGKIMSDDIGDYKQAIDLIVECGRLLHVRWLQAKLIKELLEVIDKYKHRHWNMILKEHKHKRSCRLWLTSQRCLEIWDILRTTRKKIYNDEKNLKHLLHIITYYSNKAKIVATTKITAEEKSSIEYSVARLLQEKRIASKLSKDISWEKNYVRPELTSKKNEYKFNVCFECLLPFEGEKIDCVSCKLVSFCCFNCMKINVDRANCHPCSDYLKSKYFPPSPTHSLNEP